MKKIKKRNVIQELMFESEDGTVFPYEGLAIEHDLELANIDLEPLKKGDINIPDLNLVGSIYKAETDKELDAIENYCELRDFTFNKPPLPALIIITDKYAVAVEDLRKISEGISKL